jgi:subtilisin family serine protease
MRRKLPFVVCAAVLAVAGCRDGSSPSEPGAIDPQLARDGQVVPGHYIVVFNDDVSDVAAEAQRRVEAHQGTLKHLYTYALKGFAAELSDVAVEELRQDPRIRLIEPDRVVRINATQSPTPSWGLDRIDQRNLPLDNSYTYNNDGAGVTLYGIDTGILFTHVDFGGRAVSGFDAIDGGSADDCNGHGSHTASTAGGATYGVAKGVSIIAVRVLNCAGSGTFAQVIAGVDWVTGDHQPGEAAVANMSLGGGATASLDLAVANSVADGVVYSLSAGNDNFDACFTSPAREPSAITVGATGGNTGSSDARASFSNFGTCLDIFAPGVNITAAWIGSNTATLTISGTSMAAPHVAGAAALYLNANPGSTPAQVASALTSNATMGVVTNPGTGSPNRLLYVGFIGGGAPNDPPVADFTYSCTPSFLCTFDGTSSTDDNGIVTYNWKSPSGATLATGPTLTRQFSGPKTFNLALQVVDGGGLSDQVTKTVVVESGPGNQPPVADFTYSCTPTFLCTFDASSSTDDNGIGSYTWRSPSGALLTTGLTFTRQFTGPKSFSLRLDVTDTNGVTSSVTKPIVVP